MGNLIVTNQELDEMEKEFKFYLVGTSGSFTTALFDALRCADTRNFRRLAEAFPAHAYQVVKHQAPDNVGLFTVVED